MNGPILQMTTAVTNPMSIQPQGGYPVMALTPNQKTLANVRENKSTFLGMAIAQIIFGVCCIGLGIASVTLCGADGVYCVYDLPGGGWIYYGKLNEVAAGIWGGALAVVFGTFGTSLACKPTVFKVVINFVMSICGIILSITMIGLEIGAAAALDRKVSLITTHSLTATFSFALLVLFIVTAVYNGIAKGYCKDCYTDEGEEVVVPARTSGLVTLPNGQIVLMQAVPQGSNQTAPVSVTSPPDYTMIHTNSVAPVPSGGLTYPEFQNELPTKF